MQIGPTKVGVEVLQSFQLDGPPGMAQWIYYWKSGMVIDADGGYRSYHSNSKLGLDYLENAGKPGHWFGLATDPNGDPIVQGPDDPRPGYYVSTTALVDRTRPPGDPRRYVDSETVPYASIPKELTLAGLGTPGIHMGDVGVAINVNRKIGDPGSACSFVVGDVGPHGKIGEGSIALAKAIGVPEDARRGGCNDGIVWAIFPGSNQGWPRNNEDVALQVLGLVEMVSGTQEIVNMAMAL